MMCGWAFGRPQVYIGLVLSLKAYLSNLIGLKEVIHQIQKTKKSDHLKKCVLKYGENIRYQVTIQEKLPDYGFLNKFQRAFT